jgi:hypothetical protein
VKTETLNWHLMPTPARYAALRQGSVFSLMVSVAVNRRTNKIGGMVSR